MDYTSYDYSKLDLKQPVYQGEGGVTGAGIYFEPPEFAGRIARVFHNDKVVSEYPNLTDRDDSIDIYLFDGTTGSSEDHDGFPSTMGYVAYDRKTNQVTVTFRGSRGGSAVQGALGGLYSKTGNPDWVTDMLIAEELQPNQELVTTGKVAAGFAATYISCKPQLVTTIAKIIKSNRKNAPLKIDYTGHSLGGALATIAFADSQTGDIRTRIKDELKNGEISSEVVDQLCNQAECFPFSAPPVFDQEAAQKVSESSEDRYHPIHIKGDPVAELGNLLRVIRGTASELLAPINGQGLILEFPDGKPFDLGSKHELYLVDELIQKRLGIKDDQVTRHWFTLKDSMVTHAAKNIPAIPISPKQAAIIFTQFNYEYFLTLSRVMAELESRTSGETALMEYLGTVGDLFQKVDPYASKEQLDEFKKKLAEVVARLDTNIANEEKSWLKYPHKLQDILVSLLKVVLALLNMALEILKGVINWFRTKTQTADHQEAIQISMSELNDECSKVVTNLSSFLENFSRHSKNPEKVDLTKYRKSLLKNLNTIRSKIGRFKNSTEVNQNIEDQSILETANKLTSDLAACIKACEKTLTESHWLKEESNLPFSLTTAAEQSNEQYQELATTTYELFKDLADLKEKMVTREKRWQKAMLPADQRDDLIDAALETAMIGTGLLFRLQTGLAELIKSLGEFKTSFFALFQSNKTTRNYMRATLGELSQTLDKTDFTTLLTVKGTRSEMKMEPPEEDVEPCRSLSP